MLHFNEVTILDLINKRLAPKIQKETTQTDTTSKKPELNQEISI